MLFAWEKREPAFLRRAANVSCVHEKSVCRSPASFLTGTILCAEHSRLRTLAELRLFLAEAGDNITVTKGANANGSEEYTVALKDGIIVSKAEAGKTTIGDAGVGYDGNYRGANAAGQSAARFGDICAGKAFLCVIGSSWRTGAESVS